MPITAALGADGFSLFLVLLLLLLMLASSLESALAFGFTLITSIPPLFPAPVLVMHVGLVGRLLLLLSGRSGGEHHMLVMSDDLLDHCVAR